MNIEQKVKQTLKKIGANKKEKIIVALSGGKDSGVVAYILKKFGHNLDYPDEQNEKSATKSKSEAMRKP